MSAPRTSPYLEKRSMRIAGHRTSVAVEREFWLVLEKLARHRGQSMPQLLGVLSAQLEGTQTLASAARVAALDFALSLEGAR